MYLDVVLLIDVIWECYSNGFLKVLCIDEKYKVLVLNVFFNFNLFIVCVYMWWFEYIMIFLWKLEDSL